VTFDSIKYVRQQLFLIRFYAGSFECCSPVWSGMKNELRWYAYLVKFEENNNNNPVYFCFDRILLSGCYLLLSEEGFSFTAQRLLSPLPQQYET
jgi:hypothetical protein